MIPKRHLVKIYAAPFEPGFLGAGHTARAVIQLPYDDSDPFIALMDDNVDKTDYLPVGGPHPHAGFETVSLLVEGEIADKVETLRAGDFQIMTAGGGIVHTDVIDQPTQGRLLQMWLNLPSRDRWITPRVQNLRADHVPELDIDGTRIRLYSGALSGIKSPVLNYVPLLVAELHMKPEVETAQKIPSEYNSFLYVLRGSVYVGDDKQILKEDETGWLNRSVVEGSSELMLKSGNKGCRLVLYGGKPQGERFVSQGPFIGDTSGDIRKVYTQYVKGKLMHISDVPAAHKIDW